MQELSSDIKRVMLYYLNEVIGETGIADLVIDANNRDALNAIHKYLLYPESIKGIMLYGPVGTGKSILIKTLQRCVKHIYNKGVIEFNAPYLRSNYYQDAPEEKFTVAYKVHLFRQIIINDIGFERPYSSGEDILQTIMFDRFEQGKVTHGTTNLTPNEFIDRYNDDKNRMMDRFKLMFQFIEVKGNSFR
jgi:DNA replication protein DnaC